MPDLMTFDAYHRVDDVLLREGAESLDDVIEWALRVVTTSSGEYAEEDNVVDVYPVDHPEGDIDRCATVYPEMVCINKGYETNKWPSGWTYLEDTNA